MKSVFKFVALYFVAFCLIANIVDIQGTDQPKLSRLTINSNFHIVATRTRDFIVLNPLLTMSGQPMFEEGQPITLTRVACNVVGGTSITVNLFSFTEASPETGGTQLLTVDLTCTPGGFSTTTSFAVSPNITARTPISLAITGMTGTVNTLRVFLEYTL